MKSSTQIIRHILIVPLALLSAIASVAKPADDRPELLARGRYLVENIGLCADCHSPRNERGEFIKERWLAGSLLGFAPTVPVPAWATEAPAIAGLAKMTEAEATRFMMTGVRPDGSRPRPPMPDFRYDAADAKAVVAYLKSLAK
jgi:mono/diheme cytochrome c family protein